MRHGPGLFAVLYMACHMYWEHSSAVTENGRVSGIKSAVDQRSTAEGDDEPIAVRTIPGEEWIKVKLGARSENDCEDYHEIRNREVKEEWAL